MIHFHRPDTELGDLVRESVDTGHQVFVIDAGPDVKTSIARFAEVLRLPEWFGQNLDALNDSLRDFRAGAPTATTLIWDWVRPLRRAHPQGYESILAVLDDSQEDRRDLEIHVLQR